MLLFSYIFNMHIMMRRLLYLIIVSDPLSSLISYPLLFSPLLFSSRLFSSSSLIFLSLPLPSLPTALSERSTSAPFPSYL